MSHARLSPSSSSRWSVCTAAPSQEDGKVDQPSEHARWGSAAHYIAERCLLDDLEPITYKGCLVVFDDKGASGVVAEADLDVVAVTVCDEMVECVETYVNFVREQALLSGGELNVEVRVPIDHITGEEGAGGTSDAVIFTDDNLMVIDLKGGRGVEVDAVENTQMLMYASGALEKLDLLGSVTSITMVIVQPRISRHPSSWTITREELNQRIEHLRTKALETRTNPQFVPGAKTCHWCKAKADCPELRRLVAESTFVDLTEDLGDQYAKLSLIEQWIEAIRQKVHDTLEQGGTVRGYKMVKGDPGHRKWASEDEVEKLMLKTFRLSKDDAYTRKLISPTQAEKLLAKQSPTRWKKLLPFIKRADPKPIVVPESDPRPAVAAPQEDFEDISDLI